MTLTQVKKLNTGDTFKRPSRNGHDVSGFRRFEVVSRDLCDLTVMDEHGYGTRLPFSDPTTKEFFRSAVSVTIQQ